MTIIDVSFFLGKTIFCISKNGLISPAGVNIKHGVRPPFGSFRQIHFDSIKEIKPNIVQFASGGISQLL